MSNGFITLKRGLTFAPLEFPKLACAVSHTTLDTYAILYRVSSDDNGVIFVHRTKDKLLAFAQTNFFVMYVSGQFRLKCQPEKNIVHDTPYLTCRTLMELGVKCMKLKRRAAHHQRHLPS